MTTVALPEVPSPAPQYSAPGLRFVAIRANLLPQEIIQARRAVVVRKRVAAAVAALVLVLVGVYGLSWWQTRSANNALAAAQQQSLALEQQQASFADLVQAQAATDSVRSQLQQVMVGDLPWAKLLTALRGTAPAGVSLDEISGTVTDTASGQAGSVAATGGLPVPTSKGLPAGTLTVTGVAKDKASVAAYADRLSKLRGLANVLVTSVASNGHKAVTFDLTADITTDALGGRWSPSITTTSPGAVPATTLGGN